MSVREGKRRREGRSEERERGKDRIGGMSVFRGGILAENLLAEKNNKLGLCCVLVLVLILN